MINNVVLVGRLTKDPDLRYTASGDAVATFSLAVNRSFTNQNGDREADFIQCVIWRKPAETLANYCRKGSLIGAVGRIQTRNYENQQGQRVYVTEVVCDNFQMLESKKDNNQSQQQRGSNQGYQQQYQQQNRQQSRQPQSSQPNQGYGQQSSLPGVDPFNRNRDPFGSASQIDIRDEDLPF